MSNSLFFKIKNKLNVDPCVVFNNVFWLAIRVQILKSQELNIDINFTYPYILIIIIKLQTLVSIILIDITWSHWLDENINKNIYIF